MHPAFSIIFFTTISGLGYGLAGVLGAGFISPETLVAKAAYVLAFALIACGLLSSTLHLRNPQRAWRAFSQWRSSWLSREGVLAIGTFIPLCILTFFAVFTSQHVGWAGILLFFGAVATVYCTSMIYASLKSIQAWHTPLTPACYLLFSAAGGCLVGVFVAQIAGQDAEVLKGLTLAFMIAAWSVKIIWRKRLKEQAPLSTPETATGLGALGKVRLFEAPHVNDNYLTHEMGFKVARKHADKLFAIALVSGGVLPVLIIVLQIVFTAPLWSEITLTISAIILHCIGILSERWLFFAEARHSVMAYYSR